MRDVASDLRLSDEFAIVLICLFGEGIWNSVLVVDGSDVVHDHVVGFLAAAVEEAAIVGWL